VESRKRIRKRLGLAAIVTATIALLLVAFAWPLYPLPLSMCRVIGDRLRVEDRWASPHRGAVIAVSGTLYGGPPGMVALECSCGNHPLVAVDPPPPWLALSSIWKQLENPSGSETDVTVPVQMVVRIDSEALGCFNLGINVRPLVMRTTGPVQRRPWSPIKRSRMRD
jgi:hypothetical protein